MRRGIIVRSQDGFSENAYRYYLTAVDGAGAVYSFGEIVAWPPEAGSLMVQRPADQRDPVANRIAPGAELNGD